MRALVLGGTGFLGSRVFHRLDAEGAQAGRVGSTAVDIAHLDEVRALLSRHRPDVIVNSAAFMPADECEKDPVRSLRINTLGQANVCEAADEIGAHVLYVSSDFVFDGSAERPYEPTDVTAPIQAYGISKRGGELATLAYSRGAVIRTASLFGSFQNEQARIPFVSRMLSLLRAGKELQIVNDVMMSPSSVDDVARMITAEAFHPSSDRILHAVNEGESSWYELTRSIAEYCDLDTSLVTPIPSTKSPSKAPRPARSSLRPSIFHDVAPRPWRESLREFLDGA